MRVLLDHSVPAPLRRFLEHHIVQTTAAQGWDRLTNGALLAEAEKHFDVFVTCDQNIVHQQRLVGRRIAIVVINTNSWPMIGAGPERVVGVVDAARAGSCEVVIFERPPRRRRPYVPPVPEN